MGDPALLLLRVVRAFRRIYDTFPHLKTGKQEAPRLGVSRITGPLRAAFDLNCSTVPLTVRTALITLDG